MRQQQELFARARESALLQERQLQQSQTEHMSSNGGDESEHGAGVTSAQGEQDTGSDESES